MTEDQYELVEKIISKAVEEGDAYLTEWEMEFVNSTADRLEKYQEGTLFSDKQTAVIEKIEKKLKEAGVL